MRRLIPLLITFFIIPIQVQAQFENVEVIIFDGPGADIVEKIGSHTSNVLSSINKVKLKGGTIGDYLDEQVFKDNNGNTGLQQLTSLMDSVSFYASYEVYETEVLTLVDGSFEVRNLDVEVDTKGNESAEPLQELVLNFSPECTLTGARFAMAKHRFQQILDDAISLEDDFRRKQIIGYLERFRTAYNRKDVDYIEQQFSDNALIIVGTKVQVAENQPGLEPNKEKVGEEKYKLIKQSKQQYINNLRNNIFKRNDFVNVEFESINVYQHPQYSEVYGVNLFQKWSSSTYSDTGYLFLMIDYEDETRPLIYVRAWQPEPFEGGAVIDINMFELIK